MQINLIVTPNEAAYILNVLAERPFKEVNTLIGKLHTTTSQQIADAEKKVTDGASDKRD